MTTVGLVGCASQKLSHPAPAKDFYVSQLFKKSRAYVEERCDEWFILSAKYGVLTPDEEVEPYDVRLGKGRSAPPIHTWALGAANDLMLRLMRYRMRNEPDPELLVLAGEQYRVVLRYLPPDLKVSVPMEGLGIGQQLAFLTKAAS